MRQTPDQTEDCKDEDGDADGFVDLVEAEFIGIGKLKIGHVPAEREQSQDQDGGEPMERPRNPTIPLARCFSQRDLLTPTMCSGNTSRKALILSTPAARFP